MADTKVSALTADTTPQATDVVYLVADPATSPVSRKLALQTLLSGAGHNVMHYATGVIGDSNYSTGAGGDATTAIQAACDAAVASGGYGAVIFPGNHTYRITSTISVAPGTLLLGVGGRDSVGFGNPPMLVWDGVDNGVMFQAAGAAGYALGIRFENLTMLSGAAISNKLGTAMRWPSTMTADSGTIFRNVWFQNMKGNAIEVLGGSTNFYLEGGRFDGIYNGYAIYADVNGRNFIGVIAGNTNYVGGGTSNGKGFLFLDCETTSGESHVQISGLHTEINQSLLETFASGTNPSDRRGVIRLGTNPSAGVQHNVSVNGWYNGSSGGLASYSNFLITATSGTDAQAAERVKLSVNNGNALHLFVASDSAATGEFRLVGGKVPTEYRVTHRSARQASFHWGFGPDAFGDAIGGGVFQRPGTYQVGGLSLLPRTSLGFSYQVGAVEYVSDATLTTIGGTYASGGSNKCLVFWNGSIWKIFAFVG